MCLFAPVAHYRVADRWRRVDGGTVVKLWGIVIDTIEIECRLPEDKFSLSKFSSAPVG